MNRRSFVGALGASVLGGRYALNASPYTKLSRIGLELYSVRDAMKADPEATLAAVRAMGYTDVEVLWSFNNFGRTPEQVRASLEKEGLHAPSGHIAPEALIKDWQKSIDAAKLIGSEYLIVPSLPAATSKSLDAWKMWADRFNNAGQIANKSGLWLAFHNEPDHMKPINGQVPLDLFIQQTDPAVVRHQLDVGNMLLGGGDPMKYFAKYKARYWSFHLKDITADKKSDTQLGKGIFDFKKFLSAVPDVGNKHCIIEDEGQASAMQHAQANLTYLKNLEF